MHLITGGPKYIKQILIETNEENDNSTITVNFNILLTLMDKLSKQKIYQKINKILMTQYSWI